MICCVILCQQSAWRLLGLCTKIYKSRCPVYCSPVLIMQEQHNMWVKILKTWSTVSLSGGLGKVGFHAVARTTVALQRSWLPVTTASDISAQRLAAAPFLILWIACVSWLSSSPDKYETSNLRQIFARFCCMHQTDYCNLAEYKLLVAKASWADTAM